MTKFRGYLVRFNSASSIIERLFGKKFYLSFSMVLNMLLALTVTLGLSACQLEEDGDKELSSPAEVDNLSAINISNVSRYGLAGSCRDVEGELRAFLINESRSQEVKSDPIDCSSKGAWAVELNATSLDEGTIKIVVRHENELENTLEYSQGEVVKDVTTPLAPTMTTVSKINQSNFRQYGLGGSCGEEGQAVGVELRDSAATANVARLESDVICSSGAWSARINAANLLDGVIRITLSLKDLAGNPVTATISSKKDMILPTVQVTTFKPYIIASTQAAYDLSGTCSEAQGEVTVSVAKPSDSASAVTPLSQPRCQENNTWTTTVNATTLPEGSLAISVSHQDDVENEQTHGQTVTKDTIVPDLTINALSALDANTPNATLSAYPISGTCNEGGRAITVSLTDSGGDSVSPSGAITCPALGGNWSAQLDASSLINGVITAAARYSDAAGNVKVAAPQTVAKATQQPTVSISGSVLNILPATQANYRVSGTCSENEQSVTVTLAGGGQTLTPITAVSCSSNQWTASFDASSLAEGNVNIAVSTQNAVGNSSGQVVKSVVKDTTAPELAINALSVINASTPDATQRAYPITGTCNEENRVITVSLTDSGGDSVSPGGVITCLASGGGWSAQLDTSSLAEGTLIASAQYSDVVGNVKVATPQTVEKDTGRPTVSISASTLNILAATQASYSVSGACSENGQSLTIVLSDDSQIVTPDNEVTCTFKQWTATFDASSLAEGEVGISFYIQDAVGNTSSLVGEVVVKDTVPPATLTFSSSPLPAINASNVSAYSLGGTCSEGDRAITVILTDTAAGTASPGEAVTCPKAGGNWSAQLDASSLAEGTVTASAQYSDVAGNVKVATPQTVVKDTERPTVGISESTLNILATTQASYSVSGACSENGRSITVTLSDSGQTLTPNAAASCSSNQWTASFNASPLAEGNVEIAVSTQDAVGNASSEVTKSVVKDVTLPNFSFSQNSPSIVNINNASRYSLRGVCSEPGQEVTVQIENNNNGTVANRLTIATQPICWSNSQWSLQVNASGLADTEGRAGFVISVTITHSDQVGNSVTSSATTTKDTIAPEPGNQCIECHHPCDHAQCLPR